MREFFTCDGKILNQNTHTLLVSCQGIVNLNKDENIEVKPWISFLHRKNNYLEINWAFNIFFGCVTCYKHKTCLHPQECIYYQHMEFSKSLNLSQSLNLSFHFSFT